MYFQIKIVLQQAKIKYINTQASTRKSTIGHAVSVKSQTAKLSKMLSAKRKKSMDKSFACITPPLACKIEKADEAEVGHLLMKSTFEAAHVVTIHAEQDDLHRKKVLQIDSRANRVIRARSGLVGLFGLV